MSSRLQSGPAVGFVASEPFTFYLVKRSLTPSKLLSAVDNKSLAAENVTLELIP
jgi:hypothetical protein